MTPSGRVVLRDPAGVEVLSYRAVDELSDGANRPLAADVRLAGGDPDHAADVVLAQLQGWARGRTQRVARGFYTSQALELERT